MTTATSYYIRDKYGGTTRLAVYLCLEVLAVSLTAYFVLSDFSIHFSLCAN
jgi:hypothetical protein